MPVSHYENFPVASLLLPRQMRGAVEAIYWFARSADDLADEGDHAADWRLAALDRYRGRLDEIEVGTPQLDANWRALAAAIATWRLPLVHFRHLLDAFCQDVTTARYPSFAELHDYCRRSANPVGRLMLHLFAADEPAAIAESDAICTSLQLLNFCQDVAIDWRKNRVYFPQDELAANGVTDAHIGAARVDAAWRRVFLLQVDRALELLAAGKPLAGRLSGRSRLELRAIVAGGERIGALLRATGGDVFSRRPVLGRIDWLAVGLQALVGVGRGSDARAFTPTPS